MEKLRNILRAFGLWTVQTLVVIGLLATVTFIRVNYYGATLALETDVVPKIQTTKNSKR